MSPVLWYPKNISEKGVVIHNAVGNALVYQVSDSIEAKNKISAVGRLSEQKDYPSLFKAFRLVSEKHPDIRLEIFGTGGDELSLRDFATKLGIDGKVDFMGTRKDAILMIADSLCYVMSSRFEGMPNALMEAMAIGLPCVSTDCPNGPRELIEDGVNGLLVPVGDHESLADAICKMIEDREFATTCAIRAKGILNTHSVENIAKQYMNYVQLVLEN